MTTYPFDTLPAQAHPLVSFRRRNARRKRAIRTLCRAVTYTVLAALMVGGAWAFIALCTIAWGPVR